MSCERWREAISAVVDGEEPATGRELLDAHLRRCENCRAFQENATVLRRHDRIDTATSQPDLARQIVKANAIADRRASWGVARLCLAAVAVFVLTSAFRPLVLGEQGATAEHEARHLGAFTAAYGIALLVVAIRPARARSILPVAGFVAGALAITAVIDVADGRVPLTGESVHIPEVLGVGLVWLLAVPGARRVDRSSRRTNPAPSLKLIGGTDRRPRKVG